MMRRLSQRAELTGKDGRLDELDELVDLHEELKRCLKVGADNAEVSCRASEEGTRASERRTRAGGGLRRARRLERVGRGQRRPQENGTRIGR